MDSGTVVTAALLTFVGLTVVNVIFQFFQLAVEEFKKCSIIRKEQKIIRQTKIGQMKIRQTKIRQAKIRQTKIRQKEMSQSAKFPPGTERAGEENAVFAGGRQRAAQGL